MIIPFAILTFLLNVHISSCDPSLNVEDIIFRLSTSTFYGVYQTPFEAISCDMHLLLYYNPILRVDPVFNILSLDFYDAIPYTKDYQKYLSDREDFQRCRLDNMFGYSQQYTRMHLNFNSKWNGGFSISTVNLADNPTTGDWSVQIKFESEIEKSKFLAINFDFEKIRSKQEIDSLVEYFNSIKGK